MEFDQVIFKKIYDVYKSIRYKKDPAEEARTVLLEPLKPRLTLLARALTGVPVNIYSAEREGGWKNDIMLLPVSYNRCETIEQNTDFYIFRTFYLAKQREIGLNWQKPGEYTPEESRKKALESSPMVLEALFDDFPNLVPIHKVIQKAEDVYAQSKEEPVDYSFLYGRWMYAEPPTVVEKNYIPDELKKPEPQDEESKKPLTEIKAKPSDDVKTIEVDREKMDDYCLTHNFEKVETADEFDGVWRQMDGDDSLQEDQEALNELNLKFTVRVDDPAHSVYQAEFSSHGVMNETVTIHPEDIVYSYDEWNFSKRSYRKDYCQVYYNYHSESSPDYYNGTLMKSRNLIEQMVRLLNKINNEYEAVKNRKDGEDVDFDAVADNYSELTGRRSPSENLYISKSKKNKDVSVLLLLDTSLSSDSYTGDRRILDIAKESAIVLGESFERLGIEFQIDSFSSRTHNHCTYKTVKDFKQPWNVGKTKVASLEPEGYTRIGPALRHAGALMKKASGTKKWIILFSDGKPNDYDKYEGQYGIEDVKKSLQELNNDKIYTSALAIETQARYYLPLMFGHQCYDILPSPNCLPISMAKFYKKLINV
ncbi:VWA domain-containing protein [Cytophagaceae bacterium ABcell3]|nr:VWA domain-containing protein [Cytophagaceae bacterium ABcell3]